VSHFQLRNTGVQRHVEFPVALDGWLWIIPEFSAAHRSRNDSVLVGESHRGEQPAALTMFQVRIDLGCTEPMRVVGRDPLTDAEAGDRDSQSLIVSLLMNRLQGFES
jgi:hypothetical protein